jgi:hypothetical protein
VTEPVVTTPAVTLTTPLVVAAGPKTTTTTSSKWSRKRNPLVASYYTGYNPENIQFAEGGQVSYKQPLQQTSYDQSFPITAYTDGQGPVGNIAVPPGLSGYSSAGFDNQVGSPLAPASPASAPSLSGVGPLSAYRNVNASPIQSQISQNPNVAYSLGIGPLSQYRG